MLGQPVDKLSISCDRPKRKMINIAKNYQRQNISK